VFTPFLPERISLSVISAAAEFRTHIELVTTQLVQAAPFTAGATLKLPLVLGRSCEIPVLPWPGGLSIQTSSRDFHDTILSC